MKAVFVLLTFFAVVYAVPKYRSFEPINVNVYKNLDRLDELYDCIRGAGNCRKLDATFKARGEDIVRTNCEDCREKEKYITGDILSLFANDDPFKLHTVMEVFDPESKNSKSFLLWVRHYKSLAHIPEIPRDVIDEFHDYESEKDIDYDRDYHPQSKFVKRGGIVGGLRRLLRGLLGVVGI